MSANKSIFKTKRRIKLGIWGLGRGMSFFKACAALNIDVVAGCDYTAHMRQRFLEANPGAFATDDVEEFLKQDIDAVLVATFCPNHADDAIRCLKAGKHVLSEVTSFHTMAEGVRLVEAVEQNGKVYNLTENYPFSKENMYLAARWKEGLFGDFMYAEYEYVHECRSLVYTYIDGVPVMPGNTVHNWRSWLNCHYYNTHSLGPVMVITGKRPVRVTALPGDVRLAGYLLDARAGMGGVTPSLISFEGGGLMRNLMGATANDAHFQRIWGTLGAAEIRHDGLHLRLGAAGCAPKLAVDVPWPELGELAAKGGHGGGDFWVLYYFAREILTGEPGPFTIYNACDCTIPGILAYRSSVENGKPLDVPDFRNKRERAAYRNDEYAQPRYDVKQGCLPGGRELDRTGKFTAIIKDLIHHTTAVRAWEDWAGVAAEVREKPKVVELGRAVLKELGAITAVYKGARTLAAAYPGTDGARVLNEMLAVGQADAVLKPRYRETVKRRVAAIGRMKG
ncbi:MAG: Gfo/Idh/MocA family oxidoreductase [Planctomycetota bacterium]